MNSTIWILDSENSGFDACNKILGFRFAVESFSSLESMVEALSACPKKPDLVIADLKVSGIKFAPDGLEEKVDEKIKDRFSGVPFMICSACDDLDIIRFCFRSGAFDFIRKPFMASELLARVDRFFLKLRQTPDKRPESKPPLGDCSSCPGADLRNKLGCRAPFHLDNTTLTLSRGPHSAVTLTAKEFRIVSLLSNSLQRKMAKREITRKIWGDVHVVSKTLDVHLANLRKKTHPIGIDICSTSQGECAMILRDIA